METKKMVTDTLLQNKGKFQYLGYISCRIRWKDDGVEQDDFISLPPITEDNDEYFVYNTTFENLLQEIENDSLDFNIIEIY